MPVARAVFERFFNLDKLCLGHSSLMDLGFRV